MFIAITTKKCEFVRREREGRVLVQGHAPPENFEKIGVFESNFKVKIASIFIEKSTKKGHVCSPGIFKQRKYDNAH